MAVAALALGPDIALAPLHGPPPDRARGADAKPLSRRPTRQPALNRANDTPAKVNGQGSGQARQPPSPARSMNQTASQFGNPRRFQSERKMLWVKPHAVSKALTSDTARQTSRRQSSGRSGRAPNRGSTGQGTRSRNCSTISRIECIFPDPSSTARPSDTRSLGAPDKTI